MCRVRKWKILLAHYENKCQWKVAAIIEKYMLLVGWQKEEETWQMLEEKVKEGKRESLSLSHPLSAAESSDEYDYMCVCVCVCVLCVCVCVCVCVCAHAIPYMYIRANRASHFGYSN